MKKKALFSIILSMVLVLSLFSGCSSKKETAPAEEATSYIGIVSAIESEMDMLLDAAEIERTDTIGGVDFHVGKLCGKDVVIVKSGIGKILSASCTATMLNNYDISAVYFTGIAGGVGDETAVLDEVIATSLVQHDYGNITNDGFVWTAGTEGAPGEERKEGENGYYPCDEGLVDLAYRSAVKVVGEDHVFKGVIASGDQFVESEEYVAFLQDEFNALACEMEGSSIALVCEQYDVPFIVIRALSDKADGKAHETFDNMADIAADNSGRIIMQMLEDDRATAGSS